MMKKLLFLGVVLAGTLLTVGAQSATFLYPTNPPAQVSLAWDRSPDVGVTGYHIYYGIGSRQYTNKTTFGNVTNVTVMLPARGTTFFFAATAYNGTGLESDFSNEASYTPKFLPPPQALRTNVVQVAMKIERSDDPTGPWTLFADLGTDVTVPGFFRSSVHVVRLTALSPPPPIPGETLRIAAPPTLPLER